MIYIPKQKTGKNVLCEWCNKEFYVTQTRLKRSETLTCSVECAANLKKNLNSEIRICEWCKDEYTTKKSSSQRFCCIECQHEWQKTNVGHKNPKFQGETIPCDYCGESFEIHKYNLYKYKHHFCSAECRQEWHRNIFSQDEEWKDKSRIRGSKTCSIIGLNTKPQIIINSLLDSMNILYENEYNVRYYSIDNYLSEYNLMIEVMGDYWHCSPIKYKNGFYNEMQKNNRTKDKAKHTYVLNNYNINILYLWESDINKNIELCKELIKLYILNDGNLIDYHSFNYHIENDNLQLNNNQINIFNTIQNPVTITV